MSQHPITVPAASEVAMTFLSKHTLPLGLKATSEGKPWNSTRRATFTLLRLPGRQVYVTCAHVLDKLREMQQESPSAEMVAYSSYGPDLLTAPCLIELKGFTFIDQDRPSLDVAVFHRLEDNLELPGMRFIDFASSYLSDPVPGESVYIVGYPAANVAVTRGKADFGIMFICFRASTVSERRIILANEHGDRYFSDYNEPCRLDIALGGLTGLSGSPAFVVRENRYRFVGIVTDCSAADCTIIISRLGCINPDGTLDHTAIAW